MAQIEQLLQDKTVYWTVPLFPRAEPLKQRMGALQTGKVITPEMSNK